MHTINTGTAAHHHMALSYSSVLTMPQLPTVLQHLPDHLPLCQPLLRTCLFLNLLAVVQQLQWRQVCAPQHSCIQEGRLLSHVHGGCLIQQRDTRHLHNGHETQPPPQPDSHHKSGWQCWAASFNHTNPGAERQALVFLSVPTICQSITVTL